ncbi:MAG: hypothetical protein IJM21_04305 [Clostridia bacterium]|nr:hypothetical protein [Clostridia bacterium]
MEDQLDALMKGLFGGGNAGGEASGAAPPEKEAEKGEKDAPEGTGGIDPKILFGLMELLGEASREDDGARLLSSLRPFMSEERAGRVDEAIRVMKLCRAARGAAKLFGEEKA